MRDETLRAVMKELGKRSAAKRLAAMTPEQKSEWGRKAQAGRVYKRKNAEPLGTPTAESKA